jgi:nucleoside phosphorylase
MDESYFRNVAMTRKHNEKSVITLSHLLGVLGLIFSFGNVRAGRVAWFYALEEDRAAFEKEAGPPQRTSNLVGGTTVREYRVGPHKVVAAKMGSGCVTTAVTVARVLALSPVDRVVSTGPAGGIGDGVKVGEWFEVGEVVAWQQGRAGEGGRIFLKEEARMVVEGWGEAGGENGDKQSVTGDRRRVLVSGEVFVASGEKRRELAREFEAELVEMNAFGLLAALESMPVKVMILRVVSDLADERASEDFSGFLKEYDGAGGKMVAELVRDLPVGKDEPAAHEALRELLEE